MMAASKRSRSKPSLDHVHDQVLIEIPKRLPIKLAYRCKCVSKRWFNAISSQYFTKKSYNFHHSHLDQSNSAFALICYDTDRDEYCRRCSDNGLDNFKLDLLFIHAHKPSEFSLDSLAPPPQSPPYKKFCVLSSNNGLILCCTVPKLYAPRYFVCDPLNKMWLAIPPTPSTSHGYNIILLCKSPFFSVNYNDKNTSVDLDSTMYSFKIVRLEEIHSNIKLDIYSSETGLWTEHLLDNSKKSNLLKDIGDYGKPFACNGLLYWETYKALIVIDPYKFRSGVVKLPHTGQHRHRYRRDTNNFFGECKGTMRMIRYQKEILTIYELEDQDIYASKWSLVQEINLLCDISSVIFHPFSKEIIYLRQRNKVISYNIKEETFKIIWSMSKSHRNDYLKVFPIVLPWWPLSQSPLIKPNTEITFEALTNYSTIPIEDYSHSSASDDEHNDSASDYYSDDHSEDVSSSD